MKYIIPQPFRTINNYNSPSIMRFTKYVVFFLSRTEILLNDEFMILKVISHNITPQEINV